MMYLKIIGSAVLLSSILTGCATIASGTTQEVTFESSPGEALVKVNGKPLGKTPMTLQLDKKSGQTLTVEKEGYKTYSTTMQVKMDPWFWGNIIFGGIFGTTTDSMSGAINEYAPGQYMITLEPESLTLSESSTQLSKRETVRRFLFSNYTNFQEDLGKSHGETLNAALYMLNVDAMSRTRAIDDLRSILFSPMDLAKPADIINHILDKYIG